MKKIIFTLLFLVVVTLSQAQNAITLDPNTTGTSTKCRLLVEGVGTSAINLSHLSGLSQVTLKATSASASTGTNNTVALFAEAKGSTSANVGVYGYSYGLNNASKNYGGLFSATSQGTGQTYGGHFECLAGSAGGYGIFSSATGSSTGGITGVFAYPGNAGTGDVTGGYFGCATGGSNTGYAIRTGTSGTNAWAGYFGGKVMVTGDLTVNGALSKGSGTFKIDHPQDPENKYLYHSFVESPDMKNIYDGVITTDSDGIAKVTLPGYFESLNVSFRYQLTCIGQFAQAIVSEEIQTNTFELKTNLPNVKVSWQVTGVRNDPYAQKNRVVTEVEKNEKDKGKYLYPEAYNLPKERGINYLPEVGQK
jgi:hypothetical protein